MSKNTLIGAVAGACFAVVGVAMIQPAQGEGDVKKPSLAFHMGLMQRYSQKLGYAIEGKNKRLAAFYAKELHEAAEAMVKAYPTYGEVNVGTLTKLMLVGDLDRMTKSVQAGDMAKSKGVYKRLIQSCNGCHAASKVDFIEINPASGSPPFNQSF